MKKTICLIMTLCIVLSLSACGMPNTNGSDVNEDQAAEAEIEKAKNEALETKREYYTMAENAVSAIRGKLKRPASMQVEEIIMYNNGTQFAYVTFSAENGVGNMSSYIYYGIVANEGTGGMFEAKNDNYEVLRKVVYGRWEDSEEIADGIYKATAGTIKDFTAFLIDLEDYKSQGYLL